MSSISAGRRADLETLPLHGAGLGIAPARWDRPHDSIGSNIYLHVKDNRIKRVVPRGNEAINEVWIADRDRFSYEGLYSADRLTIPLIKVNGCWQEVDWDRVLGFAIDGLKRVLGAQGPGQIGALVSPQATVEELYLLQKFMRGLGSNHIDHRLRQLDFTDQDQAPLFPWLGQTLTDLERVDAALLIGSYVRNEQPIANHRLRKAALRGGRVMVVNPLDKALLDRSPEGGCRARHGRPIKEC